MAKELEVLRASGVPDDEVQAAVSRVMRANIHLNVSRNVEQIRVGDVITLRIQAIRIGGSEQLAVDACLEAVERVCQA